MVLNPFIPTELSQREPGFRLSLRYLRTVVPKVSGPMKPVVRETHHPGNPKLNFPVRDIVRPGDKGGRSFMCHFAVSSV